MPPDPPARVLPPRYIEAWPTAAAGNRRLRGEVEKDLKYAVETGLAIGADLPLTDATRILFAGAMRLGLGDLNITGVAQLFSEP